MSLSRQTRQSMTTTLTVRASRVLGASTAFAAGRGRGVQGRRLVLEDHMTRGHGGHFCCWARPACRQQAIDPNAWERLCTGPQTWGV